MSFSDFYDAFLAYKLANDLSEINRRDKQLKKLRAHSADVKHRAKILTDEYKRLVQIGDSEEANKVALQIEDLRIEIRELTAEFDRFNNES